MLQGSEIKAPHSPDSPTVNIHLFKLNDSDLVELVINSTHTHAHTPYQIVKIKLFHLKLGHTYTSIGGGTKY